MWLLVLLVLLPLMLEVSCSWCFFIVCVVDPFWSIFPYICHPSHPLSLDAVEEHLLTKVFVTDMFCL